MSKRGTTLASALAAVAVALAATLALPASAQALTLSLQSKVQMEYDGSEDWMVQYAPTPAGDAITMEVTGTFADGEKTVTVSGDGAAIEGLVPGNAYTIREVAGPNNCAPIASEFTFTATDTGADPASGGIDWNDYVPDSWDDHFPGDKYYPDGEWWVSRDGTQVVANHRPLILTAGAPSGTVTLVDLGTDGTGTDSSSREVGRWSPWRIKGESDLRLGHSYEVYAGSDEDHAVRLSISDAGKITLDSDVFSGPANPWSLGCDPTGYYSLYYNTGDFVSVIVEKEGKPLHASDDYVSVCIGADSWFMQTHNDENGRVFFDNLVDGETYDLFVPYPSYGYAFPTTEKVKVTYHADTHTLTLAQDAWPAGYRLGSDGCVHVNYSNPAPAAEVAVTAPSAAGKVEGEKIVWTVTVANPGTAVLEDATVTCPLTGDEWAIDELPAGETATFTTAGHAIAADEMAAGSVTAEVTVSADALDEDATGSCPVALDAPAPALEVTKSVSNAPADGKAFRPGEAIEYSVTVRNSGNVTVRDVSVSDPTADSAGTRAAATVPSLAPGAEAEVAFSHVVTDADVAEAAARADRPGYLASTAVATGEPAAGDLAPADAAADAPVAATEREPEPVPESGKPADGTKPADAKPAAAAKPAAVTPATGDAAAALALAPAASAVLLAASSLLRRRAR